MSDLNRRVIVNSIVVRNLPPDLTTEELRELFSQCGQILSTKILPPNPNYDGGYGFVNFADTKSCDIAVETMDKYMLRSFKIYVNLAKPRPGNNSIDRAHTELRAGGDSNGRTMSAMNTNLDESNTIASPGTPSRVNGFRPYSERPTSNTQFKSVPAYSSQLSSNELDAVSNTSKSPGDSTVEVQSQNTVNSKSPLTNGSVDIYQSMIIKEHVPLASNQTHHIYLSNLEPANVVFAATLDDYVSATLLITQMNKHEQLSKVQANSYKSKLTVGQVCAALFNKDWYRARVLEVAENRVRVQYIDWGNTGWCDPVLEIRPLPSVYYKDPALCVKCILDGVPSVDKLADEQKNTILSILVLDVKLEMTVLRIENSLPHVRLNLGQRNLNNEVRATFFSSTSLKSAPSLTFDSNRPDVNPSDVHFVQLTAIDVDSDCFHVLLMRDWLVTIMNALKDWKASKQPLTGRPKPNTLVCAQYDGDDLWYRAWIRSVTDAGAYVYFVDFGNEELVSYDRLSECPDVLKSIPWQSVQITLANIKLTDEERCVLLRDFETARLEMKITEENQHVYLVDLIHNGKSLVEHILELRKKEPKQQPQMIRAKPNEVSTAAFQSSKVLTEPITKASTRSSTLESQTTVKAASPTVHDQTPHSVQPVQSASNKTDQLTTAPTADATKQPLVTSTIAVTQQPAASNPSNDTTLNDNFNTLITEQRRQNRLLEQVIAAINTTNALLTQLVQR